MVLIFLILLNVCRVFPIFLLKSVILKARLIFLFFNPYIAQLIDELSKANNPVYTLASSIAWFRFETNPSRTTTTPYGNQNRINNPKTNINSLVFSKDVCILWVEILKILISVSLFLFCNILKVMRTTLIKRMNVATIDAK